MKDHSSFVFRNMAYGNGRFIVHTGWGDDNLLKISEDGVKWERVVMDKRWSGLTFGGEYFIVGTWRGSAISEDGRTWNDSTGTSLAGVIRQFGGGVPGVAAGFGDGKGNIHLGRCQNVGRCRSL